MSPDVPQAPHNPQSRGEKRAAANQLSRRARRIARRQIPEETPDSQAPVSAQPPRNPVVPAVPSVKPRGASANPSRIPPAQVPSTPIPPTRVRPPSTQPPAAQPPSTQPSPGVQPPYTQPPAVQPPTARALPQPTTTSQSDAQPAAFRRQTRRAHFAAPNPQNFRTQPADTPGYEEDIYDFDEHEEVERTDVPKDFADNEDYEEDRTTHGPKSRGDSTTPAPQPSPENTGLTTIFSPRKAFATLRDQSKPPASTTAPKPPPGTLKSNLIGIFSGLLIAPISMIFLIWGCKTMMEATYSGGVAAVILGIFELLAGTSLLTLTGVITGYYSSLSWAVSALWPVALTVLAGPIRAAVATYRDTLTSVSEYSLWWDFLNGVSTLTASGLFPTMAIVMVGASLASQVAYLSGRTSTLKEHEVMETVDLEIGAPVVPRSRFRDHFLSIFVAVFCTITGMLSLIPLHDRLAVITGAAGHISDLPQVAQFSLPILGILLLFIAVYAGSKSAAGLIFAGIFCGLIPGLILAFGEISASSWAESLVGFLAHNLTASMHVSGGPLTTFGFVLISCGLTLYWCRQSGQRDQRADIAAAND